MDEESEPTVLGYMTRVATRLQSVATVVQEIQADLLSAYQITVAQDRPAVQIEFLRAEVHALQGILNEQVLGLVHKVGWAEVTRPE